MEVVGGIWSNAVPTSMVLEMTPLSPNAQLSSSFYRRGVEKTRVNFFSFFLFRSLWAKVGNTSIARTLTNR